MVSLCENVQKQLDKKKHLPICDWACENRACGNIKFSYFLKIVRRPCHCAMVIQFYHINLVIDFIIQVTEYEINILFQH